ncbi:hypothetical protein NDU88_004742 [Pleurodeles waltl]|uniref:Uncharacterized protein n=1 Tax=Pleurodeles waltl TaxID=8319 RepID=A0AAV7MVG3_PLEWA|nr:hypothetical protein NDU88_004742 [Pleurodeles waltl]
MPSTWRVTCALLFPRDGGCRNQLLPARRVVCLVAGGRCGVFLRSVSLLPGVPSPLCVTCALLFPEDGGCKSQLLLVGRARRRARCRVLAGGARRLVQAVPRRLRLPAFTATKVACSKRSPAAAGQERRARSWPLWFRFTCGVASLQQQSGPPHLMDSLPAERLRLAEFTAGSRRLL